MKSGNGMPGASHDQDSADRYGRGASQPVRDIQEIIAKLEVVTRRLAFPVRAVPVPRGNADPDDSESPGSPPQG
ncbi:MAG: hypothetical protein JOY82_28115 [Streptosporangiaceae bacterium]|nr:hypothetical protein [Streptosporangiaceae bacterium]MBV9858352.1 hypothetical protein [Streptosporangiaceae bacterium]